MKVPGWAALSAGTKLKAKLTGAAAVGGYISGHSVAKADEKAVSARYGAGIAALAAGSVLFLGKPAAKGIAKHFTPKIKSAGNIIFRRVKGRIVPIKP